MSWRIMTSYADYVYQRCLLLRDPIYRGVRVPRGNGEPVLLIPGFLAGDWSLAVLTDWLDRLGYRVHCSGIEWNIGCPQRTSDLLRWRLARVAKETQQPVTIIGHSLGGVLARFLGASDPRYVRRVIAVGSPIDGSMRIHPLVPFTFKMIQRVQGLSQRPLPSCAKDVRCSCDFVADAFAPLPEEVRYTAIYSRQDEIVDWRACIDEAKENYEVPGQHLGLIVNVEVYRLLGRLLVHHPSAERTSKNDDRRQPPAVPPSRFSIAA
jgi:pimeloyl-ACP methyl ester carboxylesterase